MDRLARLASAAGLARAASFLDSDRVRENFGGTGGLGQGGFFGSDTVAALRGSAERSMLGLSGYRVGGSAPEEAYFARMERQAIERQRRERRNPADVFPNPHRRARYAPTPTGVRTSRERARVIAGMAGTGDDRARERARLRLGMPPELARRMARPGTPAAAADAVRGLPFVGLNADWSVRAWQLTPGRANVTPGAAYLLDDDEAGEWVIVRRWYLDDNYAGIPDEYAAWADGDNDAIVSLHAASTPQAALAWWRKHGGARANDGRGAAMVGVSTDELEAYARLAARLGLPRVEAWLREAATPLQVPTTDTVEAGEADPYAETEATRRRANLAALQVLADARERARARSVFDAGGPENIQRLRGYSGWGGIDLAKIQHSQRALLPPDIQRYLAITDEREAAKAASLREGRRPREAELPQYGEVRGALRGLIDQFFTPLEVARAMTKWAMRIYQSVNAGATPARGLEPSAGIGRFARAFVLDYPNAPTAWDLVEYDADLADMLRLLFVAHHEGKATFRVTPGMFEAFASGWGGPPYDLVCANPPYAKRGIGVSIDAPYKAWGEAAHYFMVRTMGMLQPRGVMVHLTPAGVLTGTDAGTRKLREALLRGAHLASAVIPPAEIFPGALLNLTISVWVKRPRYLDAVLEADRDVLEGRYFEAPATAAGIMGRPQGGHYRPEAIVGTFDEDVMERQPVRVPPASLLAATLPDLAPATVEAPRATAPAAVSGDAAIAESLGERVVAFRRALAENRELAKAAQPELQADLLEFAHAIGRKPAEIRREVRTPSAAMLAFLSAFNEDGTLAPALTERVQPPPLAYDGARTAPAIALHVARARGMARVFDVANLLGAEPSVVELMLAPDLYFEPDPDDPSGVVFERAEEFFSGAVYPKVDWLRRVADAPHALRVGALSPAAASAIAKKCAAAADRLVALTEPKPIDQIDIGLRSMFLIEPNGEYPLLRDYARQRLNLDVERVYVDNGLVLARSASETGWLNAELQNLLDYVNRQDHNYDTRGRKRSRQDDQAALTDRIAADRKQDEMFAAFVREHQSAAQVEARYNRAYRGWIPRVYSTAPLPLARMPAEIARELRPHVWAAIRRGVEREGGIEAQDVGLGKTAVSLGIFATLRQAAKVRRPMFVVPNSVGPNWLEEIQKWFPGMRAVLVGSTVREGGRTSPDKAEVIAAKLQAFASGRYDCAVVQASTFERISVDAERLRETFVRDFSVQREVSLSKRKDQADAARLDALRGELATTRGVKAEAIKDQIDRLLVEPWLERLAEDRRKAEARGDKKGVKAIDKQIKRYQKQQSVTDRKRASDAERFDKWVSERIAPHSNAVPGVQWEDLRVDMLVVDEAHEYKNLHGAQQRYGKKAKYMGAMAADKVVRKCWDLYAKATMVRERHDDRRVWLLTATPAKNSPLEIYNLLTYCTRAAFLDRGIVDPEGYIDRYCSPESGPILTVQGGFREDLMVVKFSNLDELRGIAETWMDVKVALGIDEWAAAQAEGRNMANIVQLPLPVATYETIHVPMDAVQEEVYQEFRAQAAAAAEEAAAKLCERDMKQLGGDGEIPRLRLPDPTGLTYARKVRIITALGHQLPAVFKASMKDGALAFSARVTYVRDLQRLEDEPGMAQEVDEAYASLRAWVEAHEELRGALDLAAPELGDYGARVVAKVEEVPTTVDVVEVDEEGDVVGGGDDDDKESLFKVMDTMSKAALDPRLLGIAIDGHPPKYRALCERVRAMRGCGHLVFADINETHAWIANALVELAGVKRDRILSVTGAMDPGARQAAARRLNGVWDYKAKRWIEEPTLDVIIGGRAIEQGMNLQVRSCAIHHLSFPWEPATVQQRNGRIVRQGNTLSKVFIFYYAARQSMDGYRLSLITGKRGWMSGLLDSANRSTNNPGAEFAGPCAMLRQLSAAPELADEYCACLENAATRRLAAVRREKAAEDFANFVANTFSARRDGPNQAAYAQQAAVYRSRVEATPDEVFPRKDLLDLATRTPVWLNAKTGVPWIEGLPVCIANTPMLVEQIAPVKGTIRIRELGSWFATDWTFGDAAEKGKSASASCEWSEDLDDARLRRRTLVATSLQIVSEALFRAHLDAGLAALELAGEMVPFLVGDQVVWARPAAAPAGGRFLGPWATSDAEAYIASVRRLTRYERVSRRYDLSRKYTGYFGRVYPADLREETP